MPKALFLFEHLGYAAQPFTEDGWTTIIVDTDNTEDNPRATHTLNWDIWESEEKLIDLAQGSEFIFAFPPCTHLTGTGAAHFQKKRQADAQVHLDAVHLLRSAERIGNAAGVPWAIENPVGLASSLWRKPDKVFSPWQYGRYLPPDDRHPDFPYYIPPRDAYTKRTCIWHSPDFIWPQMRWLEKPKGGAWAASLLGGKNQRTARIRSASPRGFFLALFQAYTEHLEKGA